MEESNVLKMNLKIIKKKRKVLFNLKKNHPMVQRILQMKNIERRDNKFSRRLAKIKKNMSKKYPSSTVY